MNDSFLMCSAASMTVDLPDLMIPEDRNKKILLFKNSFYRLNADQKKNICQAYFDYMQSEDVPVLIKDEDSQSGRMKVDGFDMSLPQIDRHWEFLLMIIFDMLDRQHKKDILSLSKRAEEASAMRKKDDMNCLLLGTLPVQTKQVITIVLDDDVKPSAKPSANLVAPPESEPVEAAVADTQVVKDEQANEQPVPVAAHLEEEVYEAPSPRVKAEDNDPALISTMECSPSDEMNIIFQTDSMHGEHPVASAVDVPLNPALAPKGPRAEPSPVEEHPSSGDIVNTPKNSENVSRNDKKWPTNDELVIGKLIKRMANKVSKGLDEVQHEGIHKVPSELANRYRDSVSLKLKRKANDNTSEKPKKLLRFNIPVFGTSGDPHLEESDEHVNENQTEQPARKDVLLKRFRVLPPKLVASPQIVDPNRLRLSNAGGDLGFANAVLQCFKSFGLYDWLSQKKRNGTTMKTLTSLLQPPFNAVRSAKELLDQLIHGGTYLTPSTRNAASFHMELIWEIVTDVFRKFYIEGRVELICTSCGYMSKVQKPEKIVMHTSEFPAGMRDIALSDLVPSEAELPQPSTKCLGCRQKRTDICRREEYFVPKACQVMTIQTPLFLDGKKVERRIIDVRNLTIRGNSWGLGACVEHIGASLGGGRYRAWICENGMWNVYEDENVWRNQNLPTHLEDMYLLYLVRQ